MSEGIQGTLYLLHVVDPTTGETARYGHAAHYAGWTHYDLAGRLSYHRAGQGSRLMRAIMAEGLDVVVARTWVGDRNDERRLKKRGSLCRSCPVCRGDARIYRHHSSGLLYVRMRPGRRQRYSLTVPRLAVQP